MNRDRPSPKLFLLLIPAILSSAITSSSYITAIPCLLLIILSYRVNFSFPKNSFNSTLACLGIFGSSLLLHFLLITNLPTGNGPHIMAASMIVLMVYLWYYQNPRLTGYLITLLSLLVIIFTGNNLDDKQNWYYLIISSLIPLSLGYLFLNYQRKFSTKTFLIIILGTLLTGSLTLVMNKLLFLTDERLNDLLQTFNDFADNSDKTGISSQMDIEAHAKLKLSNKAVAVLKAKKVSYLRTEVFVNYSRKSWSTIQNYSKDPVIFAYKDEKVSTYDKKTSNELKVLSDNSIKNGSIQILEKSSFIPLPAYTRAFKSNNLKIKPYHIVSSETKNNAGTLEFLGVDTESYDYKTNNNDLDINPELTAQLINKSLLITKSGKNNLEKSNLLESYFHKNYTYSLDVAFDPAKDPIIDFIFEKKQGFCLHFASGMVLMLRSVGVPCHLVSGYLVSEYSKSLRANIIRERDAHAWVEVYDKKNHSWVTFDPTPVSMMNEYINSKPDFKDDFTMYFKIFVLGLSSFFGIFSIENISKIGQSRYTLYVGLLALGYIIYRNYISREIKAKNGFTLENDIEVLIKKILKAIENKNLKFTDNMTYLELIEKINNSEIIEMSEKEMLVNLINNYQKYRYSHMRNKEDYDKIVETLEKIT